MINELGEREREGRREKEKKRKRTREEREEQRGRRSKASANQLPQSKPQWLTFQRDIDGSLTGQHWHLKA
jgi:hypothetical protein